MEQYSSYEKETINVVERVKHIVRIKLNESAASVLHTLENVPANAIVTMVVDDNEGGGYGEIVFEEQKSV